MINVIKRVGIGIVVLVAVCDLAKKAVAALKAQGVDVTGKNYKKGVVVLEEGGK